MNTLRSRSNANSSTSARLTRHDSKRSYTNVMERLVAAEVDRQLEKLPLTVLKYVKRTEVETYALNRLPALYASSEQGWQYQCKKARVELQQQVRAAVRQALAAVQADPLRLSKPLEVVESEESYAALQALRSALKQPDLSWEGIVQHVRQLNAQAHSSTVNPVGETQGRQTWRPGTYGVNVAWKSQSSLSQQTFDWSDSRYQR